MAPAFGAGAAPASTRRAARGLLEGRGFRGRTAGLAACQGVELGVGVAPAVPPPDPSLARLIEDAGVGGAGAEERTQEAARMAAEAEAERAAAAPPMLFPFGPPRPHR